MVEFLQSWCALIVFFLAIMVVQFWLQLLKWKNRWEQHAAWQDKHCACETPGANPEPTQPTWP